MLFYYLIFFSASCSAYLMKKVKTRREEYLVKSIVFYILFIPAAFRFMSGPDFLNYVVLYQEIRNNVCSVDIEIGYMMLNKLIIFLHLSPQWIFIICSFITYINIINSERNVFFQTVTIYILFWYLNSLFLIRQAVSYSLAWHAYLCLKAKDNRKCIIFSILSCLFHYSSIVYPLIFYTIKMKSFKKKSILIVSLFIIIFSQIITVPILYSICKGFLRQRYLDYLVPNGGWAIGTKRTGLAVLSRRVFLIASFILVRKKYFINPKEYNIFCCYYLILVLSESYLDQLGIVIRFVTIANVYYIILFRILYNNKNSVIKAFKLLFIIFYVIINIHIQLIDMKKDSRFLIPYKTFIGVDYNTFDPINYINSPF